MNETTNLNSELLSADARGRKHIPLAVFAVILIHIVLFLVLLIAAGCRAKARAIRSSQAPAEIADLQEKPLVTTNAPAAVVAESRIVTESPAQAQRTAPPTVRQTPQRSSAPQSGRSAAK